MEEATTSFSGFCFGVEHGLQEFRRAERVHAHVAADLVHGLTDTDSRGEVKDNVDVSEYFADAIRVTDVADDQLDLGREIAGRPVIVHLRRQVVEDAHVVPRGEQTVRKVRSNKAGAAGDEHTLASRAGVISVCGGLRHRVTVSSCDGCGSERSSSDCVVCGGKLADAVLTA